MVGASYFHPTRLRFKDRAKTRSRITSSIDEKKSHTCCILLLVKEGSYGGEVGPPRLVVPQRRYRIVVLVFFRKGIKTYQKEKYEVVSIKSIKPIKRFTSAHRAGQCWIRFPGA